MFVCMFFPTLCQVARVVAECMCVRMHACLLVCMHVCRVKKPLTSSKKPL
jgi:hypothetical protein